MIDAQVQGGEIVPVVLDLRAFCDGEAHPPENGYDPVAHEGDRVASSDGQRVTGQGGIRSFRSGIRYRHGLLQGGIPGFRDLLEGVHHLAEVATAVGRHVLHLAHQGLDEPLGAQEFDPEGFQQFRVRGLECAYLFLVGFDLRQDCIHPAKI